MQNKCVRCAKCLNQMSMEEPRKDLEQVKGDKTDSVSCRAPKLSVPIIGSILAVDAWLEWIVYPVTHKEGGEINVSHGVRRTNFGHGMDSEWR
jgi:hypothetical protein